MGGKNISYVETGETRPPLAGEWFRHPRGVATQARFDFVGLSYPILRLVVENVEEAEAREEAEDV